MPGKNIAQIKNISGSLGAEFRSQNYFYKSSKSIYSKFSQMIDISSAGYVYNENLINFNFSSSLMNANTNSSSQNTDLSLNERLFNFFDINANILQSSNFPLIINVKNNLNTNSVESPFGSIFSNKLITHSKGFMFAPKINVSGRSKINLFTLRYNDIQSESTNPSVPLNQTNQDVQLSFEPPEFLKTQFNLDLNYRKRNDRINNNTYKIYEAYLRGRSQPNPTNQISFNSNVWYENSFQSFFSNIFWNSQSIKNLSNQINGQFRWMKYISSAYSMEGAISDQLNVNYSENLSSNFMLSYSEGKSSFQEKQIKNRIVLISSDLRYQKNFDNYLINLSAQGGYNRIQNENIQPSFQGLVSASVNTQGFSFGQITISDQVSFRKIQGNYAQTVVQNSFATSFETNFISNLFLRSSGSYSVNHTTGTIDYHEKNAMLLGNLTYRWTKGITFFLTLNYGLNYSSNGIYRYSVNKYSVTLQLPNIINNLSVSGRITKTLDPIRLMKEINYDVFATYNWRALAFTFRVVGYNIPALKRNDLFFTVTRPFNIMFE